MAPSAMSQNDQRRTASSGALRPFGGGFLRGASVLEHVRQPVVCLVTGVLVEALVYPAHAHGGAPGPRPDRRIIDGEFVQQRIAIGACEAFNEMQVLIGGCAVQQPASSPV